MSSSLTFAAFVLLGLVAFWYFNTRPANASAESVAGLLRALRQGTVSSRDWDNFISVKIGDPRLEAIRQQVVAMWVEDSPFLIAGSMNPSDLTAEGVANLDKLIADVEKLC